MFVTLFLTRARREIELNPVRSLVGMAALFLPAAVAICFLFTGQWRENAVRLVLDQARSELNGNCAAVVERVEREFQKVRKLSELLALDPRVVELLRHGGQERARELNVYLRDFAAALGLHRAFVLDARAACVVSNDYAGVKTLIGQRFQDRTYFTEAMQGRQGTQFVVGRVSTVPGFHFSWPIRFGGEIIGAATVKIDLETFADQIRFSSGFVTDEHGVVVLADHPEHLLRAAPGSPVLSQPREELLRRYQRERIETLSLEVESIDGEPAYRYHDHPEPSLRQIVSMPRDGLVLHAFKRLDGLSPIRERYLLRLYLAILSSALSLTLLLAVVVYVVRDGYQRRELLKLNEELKRQAQLDALTGCYNRRKFDEALRQEIKRAGRVGQPLALAFLDLDFFKRVNDTHGHGVGDCMLRHVADVLRGELRETDTLARIGGEEFAIILPGVEEEQTIPLLNRLRERVEASPLPVGGAWLVQTISAGVASARGEEKSSETLLHEADTALYVAKKCGRNRVVRSSAVDQTIAIADVTGSACPD